VKGGWARARGGRGRRRRAAGAVQAAFRCCRSRQWPPRSWSCSPAVPTCSPTCCGTGTGRSAAGFIVDSAPPQDLGRRGASALVGRQLLYRCRAGRWMAVRHHRPSLSAAACGVQVLARGSLHAIDVGADVADRLCLLRLVIGPAAVSSCSAAASGWRLRACRAAAPGPARRPLARMTGLPVQVGFGRHSLGRTGRFVSS
jgi:hypothetical protein